MAYKWLSSQKQNPNLPNTSGSPQNTWGILLRILHPKHLSNCIFHFGCCPWHALSNHLLYVGMYSRILYTSIAARGGGGSFKREKIYNSEEQVPIEFVRVTCFNNAHFEEPFFFNMCGSQNCTSANHPKHSRMADWDRKAHCINIIYSARSIRCHDPTSPNTAPVTQKDSHT